MNKIKSVDEAKFWELVSQVNWASDHNYTRIKVELMKNLTPEAQEEYSNLFTKIRGRLGSKIDKYCEDNETSTHCSDDSFSDLLSHIVGLGKAEFDKVMADPELGVQRGQKGKYRESFSFSVPYQSDREYTSKDKYTSKAKEFLETEAIAEFLSLPEAKQNALSVLNDIDVKASVSRLVAALQEVASGNFKSMDSSEYTSQAVGYTQLSSSELYQAWSLASKVLKLHYAIPNLIKDYNEFKDLIE